MSERPRSQLDAFEKDLCNLIQKHRLEDATHTPNVAIAKAMIGGLEGFERALRMREAYYMIVEEATAHSESEGSKLK